VQNVIICSGVSRICKRQRRRKGWTWWANPGGCRVPGQKIVIIFPLLHNPAGSRGGWCIDLPNNAGIVLSPGQNLQIITIQNCVCCMHVLCTWVKLFNRFVDFVL